MLETVFCDLPKPHRTMEVWLAICHAGGMRSEKQKKLAHEHIRLALAVTAHG